MWVQRPQARVEAWVMLLGVGSSMGEVGVREKTRMKLLQVGCMRRALKVGTGEVWVRVHSEVACPLKVFPQDLSALILVNEAAPWRS